MEGFKNIGVSHFCKKDTESFRICTFNVHMFKDYHMNDSIEEIFEDINNINSDVIVLEEAVFFGKTLRAKFNECVSKTKYKYVEMCNKKYGINIILSKHKLSNVKVIPLGKGSVGTVNRYALSCNVKIHDKLFQIIGCHLDVYDETERTRCNQIKIILANVVLKNAIVLGDLNALRRDDYTDSQWDTIRLIDENRGVISKTNLIDLFESNKFVDSFKMSKTHPPIISTWSDRRVDYVYIGLQSQIKKMESHILKTLSSDHYPIYVDIV